MTARCSYHLAFTAYAIALAGTICWACLVFVVPLVDQQWKGSAAPPPAVLALLFKASGRTHDPRLAAVVIGLFAGATAWRVTAKNRLRREAAVSGFDVVRGMQKD